MSNKSIDVNNKESILNNSRTINDLSNRCLKEELQDIKKINTNVDLNSRKKHSHRKEQKLSYKKNNTKDLIKEHVKNKNNDVNLPFNNKKTMYICALIHMVNYKIIFIN